LKKIYTKLDQYNFFNHLLNRKNQAEFEILDSKIDNEHYSDEELKVIEHRKKALIFQNDLKIDEKNLNILKYLNLYENSSEALILYKNCKGLLTYDSNENKLKIINENIYTDFEKKRKSINWIWNIGIILNFIFILFLTFDPSVKNGSVNLLNFIVPISLTIILISLIIFKISRHYEKYNDAERLLSLSRVKIDILNE